jgi:hypothetical protein
VLEAFSSQRFVRDTAQLYLDAWDRHVHHPMAKTIEETGQPVSRPDAERDQRDHEHEYFASGRR